MAKNAKKAISKVANRIGAKAANNHDNYGRDMFFANCRRQQACLESTPKLSQKMSKPTTNTNT